VGRNIDSGAVLFIGKGKGGGALDPLKSRLCRKAELDTGMKSSCS
jgi:hypothetical protein